MLRKTRVDGKDIRNERETKYISFGPRTNGGYKKTSIQPNKKASKPSISWKNDADLVEIRYFELDRTERVKVVRTFRDLAKMEIKSERKALQLLRSVSKGAQIKWKIPYVIVQDDPLADEPGCEDLETNIQCARVKRTLKRVHSGFLDILDEPPPKRIRLNDPKGISLEDHESQDRNNRLASRKELEPRNQNFYGPFNSKLPPTSQAPGVPGACTNHFTENRQISYLSLEDPEGSQTDLGWLNSNPPISEIILKSLNSLLPTAPREPSPRYAVACVSNDRPQGIPENANVEQRTTLWIDSNLFASLPEPQEPSISAITHRSFNNMTSTTFLEPPLEGGKLDLSTNTWMDSNGIACVPEPVLSPEITLGSFNNSTPSALQESVRQEPAACGSDDASMGLMKMPWMDSKVYANLPEPVISPISTNIQASSNNIPSSTLQGAFSRCLVPDVSRVPSKFTLEISEGGTMHLGTTSASKDLPHISETVMVPLNTGMMDSKVFANGAFTQDSDSQINFDIHRLHSGGRSVEVGHYKRGKHVQWVPSEEMELEVWNPGYHIRVQKNCFKLD